MQRLEKVMQDAGSKLTSVASALLTKSGRAGGASGRAECPSISPSWPGVGCAGRSPPLREALASRFRVEHHGLLAAQMLVHIDFPMRPLA